MNKMAALVKFAHYSVYKNDLEFIHQDLIAALSLICFSANEVTTLQRIYLAFSREAPEDDIAKKIFNNHNLFILRTWASKIFEVVEFLDLKNHNATKNEILKELCASAKNDFRDRGLVDQLSFARDIRNEISNHVSLKAARKNIEYLAKDADLTLYMHKAEGNSYYSLGEEIVFSGRLNRALKGLSEVEKRKRFEEWLTWNLKANTWMRETMADFANEILFKALPDRHAYEKDHWIEADFVGEIHQTRAPFLFRRE